MDDTYFNWEKVLELTSQRNWELVRLKEGKFRLEQKDKRYILTVPFNADEQTKKYFTELNRRTTHGRD